MKASLDAGKVVDAGIEFTACPGYSSAVAYESVQVALASRRKFTAMVTFNDAVATGALAALADYGLSVPDDVSFVSFGSGHRDFSRPQVTSVTFDEQRIAGLSANRLIDRIEGLTDLAPNLEYLPLTLTIRTSSRRLPKT